MVANNGPDEQPEYQEGRLDDHRILGTQDSMATNGYAGVAWPADIAVDATQPDGADHQNQTSWLSVVA